MRSVLAGAQLDEHLTQRSNAKLTELRDDYAWSQEGRTALVRDSVRSRTRWWTFGGARANQVIAAHLDAHGVATMGVDDLGIGLRSSSPLEAITAAAAELDPPTSRRPVDKRRLDTVESGSCVPDDVLEEMLSARDADVAGVAAVVAEPVTLAQE